MKRRAIENDFPFEEIDPVADRESWRKEINRPIYHIHKWWANRLGSVFRAIVLGALEDESASVWDGYYKHHDFSDKVVLDPFMGSGTTLGEALKLGARVVGCDINPVSSFIVRQAFQQVDIEQLHQTFLELEKNVASRIQSYYETTDPTSGEVCKVLYCFWVKTVLTPEGEEIPLFSNYIFSSNAYPQRKPESQIVCPKCWEIGIGRYDCVAFICSSCGVEFNPQEGPVSGQFVTVSTGQRYKVGDLVRAQNTPPSHKLYALMVLDLSGNKRYLKASPRDLELFNKASRELQDLDLPLPTMAVRPGHNTNQARGYNYLAWRDFFNDRQLLCLGLLLKEILKIKDRVLRDHFLCLFSGTLEFNNMFCSFKGEGTGAVRHMFSNHILKPERTPLENSVWGIDGKSSGTFSTLFRSRLLKAKEYLNRPFELSVEGKTSGSDGKVYCDQPINTKVTQDVMEFEQAKGNTALVLNGDSATLPLPSNSVDAVITDPPYFDFVHYSELSDFFYSWLSEAVGKEYQEFRQSDSSSPGEVQDKSPKDFAKNLGKVFSEAARVLKPTGVLVFSFHHSRVEGWLSIYEAIRTSGLQIVAAHPVKAEMSVGSPKTAAKHPINLDAIIVCKKSVGQAIESDRWQAAVSDYLNYSRRFDNIGRMLSLGDRKVILASQVLKHCSSARLEEGHVELLLTRVYTEELHLLKDQPNQVQPRGMATPSEGVAVRGY